MEEREDKSFALGSTSRRRVGDGLEPEPRQGETPILWPPDAKS